MLVSQLERNLVTVQHRQDVDQIASIEPHRHFSSVIVDFELVLRLAKVRITGGTRSTFSARLIFTAFDLSADNKAIRFSASRNRDFGMVATRSLCSGMTRWYSGNWPSIRRITIVKPDFLNSTEFCAKPNWHSASGASSSSLLSS